MTERMQNQWMSKRLQKRTQTTPVNFLDLLNLNVIDKEVLKLLREYMLRRRLTVLSSFTIILLISLNSTFLCVYMYDCRTFNLCWVDEEESKPFFFWILFGLNLTFATVLIFIVLHLKHCKQFYVENLTRLVARALNRQRTGSEATSGGFSEVSLVDQANHHLAFNHNLAFNDQNIVKNQSNQIPNLVEPGHRKLTKLLENHVPSIAVVHFDNGTTKGDLNKQTCYDNLAFDNSSLDKKTFENRAFHNPAFDLGIELSEMGIRKETIVAAKESCS